MPSAFDRHMDGLKNKAQQEAIKKILGSGNFASNQKNEQHQAKKDRLGADYHPEKNADSIILSKSDVKGNYDASRMLKTTLGGEIRAITKEDLAAFEKNIATAQDKYQGGITPQQIIDHSLKDDILRSNQQIHLAAVFSRKGSIFRYVTNASATSNVTRHYVTVQMIGYDKMLTGAKDPSIYVIKSNVSGGKVRFDCDCGRHRYWFRFIATKGKYNYGMDEHGYPKIRNPNLVGVACKHVLRVMQQILSATGAQYIKNQIDKDRNDAEKHEKTKSSTVAQVRKDLAAKVEVSHHKRNQVTQTQDKPNYIQKMRKPPAAVAAARAIQKETVHKAASQMMKEKQAGLEAAFKAGILTKNVYESLLQDIGKK
jgi:hypothetical protein